MLVSNGCLPCGTFLGVWFLSFAETSMLLSDRFFFNAIRGGIG